MNDGLTYEQRNKVFKADIARIEDIIEACREKLDEYLRGESDLTQAEGDYYRGFLDGLRRSLSVLKGLG